ncbi:MAG: very short patch repair endonuclease [Candidatus Margulisbacteria bacterium]|nr:very short patch repair endonuclease [Candidatus Margulisiibacteriota bacterium]
MVDKFDKKTRSRIMAAIRSTNTSPERAVFKAIKKQNIHFQRHYKKNALGTPDLAVPSRKIAVYIDGDFWHGFRFPIWKRRLTNSFWRKKMERNRKRDNLYHGRLRNIEWKVLREWEHQLKNDFRGTIDKIIFFLDQQ